jgi:hypothetical protein
MNKDKGMHITLVSHKMAKTHGGNTQSKSPAGAQTTYRRYTSAPFSKERHAYYLGVEQPPTNLQEDDKNKDKEVLADPSDSDKKLRVGGNLDAN